MEVTSAAVDIDLIGAIYNNDGASYGGAAYVVLGASLGQDVELALADADYKLVGSVSRELAGTVVEGIGDVDGDGREDLLIGAPSSGYDKVPGTVYLVLGDSLPVSGLMSLADADGTWSGEAPVNNEYGTGFGYSLSPAGDLDGDGIGDVLIGIPGDDDGGSNAGAVLIGLSGD